jgi:signal transduction histidine kinase
MSLHRRITAIFITLVAVGCILFSGIALVVLVRTMRADMDARMATLARGIGQIVDYRHGQLHISRRDAVQIRSLLGPDEHIAIFERGGGLFFGEHLPPQRERGEFRFGSTTTIQQGNYGTIVAWQGAAPIGGLVRSSLLAFAAVTLVLVAAAALLATLMSGTVRRLIARIESERRFVADASHELRTPLAVIRAETDLALRRDRDGEEYRSAFRSIDGEVARLEGLVDDLLDTMRDRAVITRDPVDVGAVVARTAARLHSSAREIRVATGADVIAFGHADSIERAIAAVCHNAITHGGGAIDLTVEASPPWIRVEVADDGPGFAPEALAHATERFWRADSARSRGGTGLGLAIARAIAEAHGGQLRLANTARGGAAVTLLFPGRFPRTEQKLVRSVDM